MIRYVHTGDVADENRKQRNAGNFDKFVFQLSDGMNYLPPVSFDVDIVGSDSSHIALLNRGIKAREGETQLLGTHVLSASDGSNDSEQLRFIVTSGPRYGRLSFADDQNDTDIRRFTQVRDSKKSLRHRRRSRRTQHGYGQGHTAER